MRVLVAAMLVCGAMAAAPAHAQTAAEVSAVCMDVRGVPHPAAQTFAERETPADFSGELYRCLAGTRLRYDVDHAVHDCAAGPALWFGGGALSCRAAQEQTREHDRDLLRRFRAGSKRVVLAVEAAPERRETPRFRY
jgi:hypothetical protein